MLLREGRPILDAPGRTLLEVLEDFPSAVPPLAWLLHAAPRLRARRFSIASSPRVHPRRAHIAAALVDYTTPFGRRKRGLCSAWLAGLAPGAPDALVPPPD